MINYSSFFHIKYGWYDTLALWYVGPGVLTENEAWALSLAKWARIVEWKKKNPDTKLDCGGVGTCGLCHLYFRDVSCATCPIAKHTGKECCYDTPYTEYGKYYRLEDAEAEFAFLEKLYKAWKETQ